MVLTGDYFDLLHRRNAILRENQPLSLSLSRARAFIYEPACPRHVKNGKLVSHIQSKHGLVFSERDSLREDPRVYLRSVLSCSALGIRNLLARKEGV